MLRTIATQVIIPAKAKILKRSAHLYCCACYNGIPCGWNWKFWKPRIFLWLHRKDVDVNKAKTPTNRIFEFKRKTR